MNHPSVTALSRGISDHCPIILTTSPADFGHIPFRFFNSWLDIPGFQDYVRHQCSMFSFSGPTNLGLAMKLKFLKNKIRVWVAGEKRRLDDEYNIKKSEVERIEKLAETRPLSPLELKVREEYRIFMLDADKRKQDI